MDKEIISKLKDKEKSSTASIFLFVESFTMNEINQALNRLKSKKAPGPDKIHNEMLVNLGPLGRKVLLNCINQTLKTGLLLSSWKNK
jgi:hypothetical protein